MLKVFLAFLDLTCHLEDIDTGIVLVPCCAWKIVPTAISGGVDILEVPGCHLLRQMSSQLASKNSFKDQCTIN